MDAIRETVEEHGQIGGGSFAYSDDFLQWEGYKSIGVEALRNIGLALLVVLIVIVALLVHPVGSVITFANVVLVVVEIIGECTPLLPPLARRMQGIKLTKQVCHAPHGRQQLFDAVSLHAGFLHFWGLTIDNVSVIFIVISLGLSVDYSVHITHSFLHREGTGNERMVSALRDMGVAVANGAPPPLRLCSVLMNV